MTTTIPTHAAKAVITNERGDILFLQRNAAGRADMRANWDLPGGLVEAGEDDTTALAREMVEELGRRASGIGETLGTWSFHRPFDGATVAVTNYPVSIETMGELSLSEEHTAAQWVPKSILTAHQLDVKDPSIFTALGL